MPERCSRIAVAPFFGRAQPAAAGIRRIRGEGGKLGLPVGLGPIADGRFKESSAAPLLPEPARMRDGSGAWQEEKRWRLAFALFYKRG